MKKKSSADGVERTVINMVVKDDTEFLSVFSASDTPVISSGVAEFIENSTNYIPGAKPLVLRIKSNCIDEQEKTTYKKAIKQYYSEKLAALERAIKLDNLISGILAFLGVLVLVFAVFIEYNFSSVVWAEVIDIVAWVLVWEAVDVGFLKNRSMKIQRNRYREYINMEIEYVSEQND